MSHEHFDTPMNDTVNVTVADGAVPVTTATPTGPGPWPALVIVPSIYGVTPDLERQMRDLAADGALVLALDSFWRGDPGPVPYDDSPRAIARMQALPPETAYADLRAVLAHTRADPRCSGHVIGLGLCFGGPFVFLAAADGALDGLATWHGSRLDLVLDRAPDIRCPLALHFGDADPVVPMATVDLVRAALAGRDDVELVVHPGCGHGFSHPGGPTYDPEATAASLASVQRLLRA